MVLFLIDRSVNEVFEIELFFWCVLFCNQINALIKYTAMKLTFVLIETELVTHFTDKKTSVTNTIIWCSTSNIMDLFI